MPKAPVRTDPKAKLPASADFKAGFQTAMDAVEALLNDGSGADDGAAAVRRDILARIRTISAPRTM